MSRKTVAFLLAFLMLPFSAMNTAAGPNDPDLSINEINFSDESPDGGDTITLTAEIANDGGPTGQQPVSTNVSFYWDDNLIGVDSVTVSGGSTEDAVMEWKAVGGSHVINVTVDQEQQVNESNEDNNIALREITVAYPPVLFLDDDSSENNGGYSTETDPYYINSLDNLTDIAYDTIVVEYGEDGPGSDTLNAYDMIIWACGADLSYTFTENDRDNISGFLDDGGSMWVIGQDILWDLNSGDGSRYEGDFEYDYLGVSQVDHDTYTPEIILGVDGDPISEGVNYSAESIGSDYADDIDPREGFEKILNSEDNDYSLPWFNTSSTRTEDDFKLVFMTVDFSSFTESDDRDEFLSKVIEYLLETVENDVSLSRFNEPKNGETIEPNVENVINLTVRNRGSEDQDNIVVSIDIDCKNSTYTFDDQTTISLDSKEMAFVEFEWDTPEDEDYEYDITAEAYISNDEKEDNDIKEITVNTNVIYDLELSLARVDPTIGQKGEEREMSVLVTNIGDISMNSQVKGRVDDGTGGTVYDGGTKSTGDLSPGESITLVWEWDTDEYGTFWFEAELQEEDDENSTNNMSSAMMRSVDIEFSDNMEDGSDGWSDYKAIANAWHLIDIEEDDKREAESGTHAMWAGDESKNDGEYDDYWDFSLYTADYITLGSNPQMAVNIWYDTEATWDGGNVQISTDGEDWEVIIPDGGYPDDSVVGLDNEPGYSGMSGDGDEAEWESANFNLGSNYSNQDVLFKFRFGSDSIISGYEGWYIDDFEIKDGLTTVSNDDFESGDGNWDAELLISEWNYLNVDEDGGKAYSGDHAWYLGNTDTWEYGNSLNDSLETPTIDLGDGSEKFISAMIWFKIDGPYDGFYVEINQSGEWEMLEDLHPGDNGDFSEDYEDADENGWLYVESEISDYEGDASFRIRFESDSSNYTAYEGLYVDDFTVYSLPPLPDDVGTRELDVPDTAKPGRPVTFYSDIYNYGTADQNTFDVRGTVTNSEGAEVFNQSKTVETLDSKDNKTLEWVWEGGPEGTYNIRVETLLDDDDRAGNNAKDKDIDIAESGYSILLAVEQQAKEVLSGESVLFNFTATNDGEKNGYFDITVENYADDDWAGVSHSQYLYIYAGSSQNFSVAVIAPTLAETGDDHQFNVTIASRDDPETQDSQDISASPLYIEQSGGDNILLIDANFGDNNGYNNYYDIDKIDERMKLAMQQYFGGTESQGYDVYTVPRDPDANENYYDGELKPYPSIDLMLEYDGVIWVQGDHHQRNLTAWKSTISGYLNQSGNMWIVGQQFLTALNSTSGNREQGSFEYDYLMIEAINNNAAITNPLLGVDNDEIFGDAQYEMDTEALGPNSPYDYTDLIRPREEAIGAFQVDEGWHIVDVTEDPEREAYNSQHSMWMGDENQGNGEYKSSSDFSIYTSESYQIGVNGQLSFYQWYETYPNYYYDGGNVQISTDDGGTWEIIEPNNGYDSTMVYGLDYEAGYNEISGGGEEPQWVQATFDLSNYSQENVKIKFRFGAYQYGGGYEGWYLDDVRLSDSTGIKFSDDMEDGMEKWEKEIFNLSLHYEGDYRLLLSPFTFGFVNTSNDREDMVKRALDWLIAGAAANDVGVKLLEITSETKEQSTIDFSSVIKNYGSEGQAAFEVEARVTDSEEPTNVIWSETQIVGPLASGEEKDLEWEWESEEPGDFQIAVEIDKDDENPNNNLKEKDFEVEMVHKPEIYTDDANKQVKSGENVDFVVTIKNNATGSDEFELESVGESAKLSITQYPDPFTLESGESEDKILTVNVDSDTEDGNYLFTISVTAGDITNNIQLIVEVTDNPNTYNVETELDSEGYLEALGGEKVDFAIIVYNKGDAEDKIGLDAQGDEPSWVNFDEDYVTIGAGGNARVTGIIEIPKDAGSGTRYIDLLAASTNDPDAHDTESISVKVEKLQTDVSLRIKGESEKTIAPGASDTINYKITNNGNGEQLLKIVPEEGVVGNWVSIPDELSSSELSLKSGDSYEFAIIVSIPFDAEEGQKLLRIKAMDGEEELDFAIASIIVKVEIQENVDLSLCLTDMSGVCISNGNFEIDIEAEKLEIESVGFLVENNGNVKVDVAFEIEMPNGVIGTGQYFDENGKEWRVDVSPAETKLYPIEIRVDDYMDYGVMAMIAKEALPGSHTFTLRILLATDDDNDDVYNFETVNQITITINVIGEIQGESEENTEDPLLPGPSFLSVILAMCALVYRRRKV